MGSCVAQSIPRRWEIESGLTFKGTPLFDVKEVGVENAHHFFLDRPQHRHEGHPLSSLQNLRQSSCVESYRIHRVFNDDGSSGEDPLVLFQAYGIVAQGERSYNPLRTRPGWRIQYRWLPKILRRIRGWATFGCGLFFGRRHDARSKSNIQWWKTKELSWDALGKDRHKMRMKKMHLAPIWITCKYCPQNTP